MKTSRTLLHVAFAAAFLALAPFTGAQTDTQTGTTGGTGQFGGNATGVFPAGNGGTGGSGGPAPNGSSNPVTATASGNSSTITATATGGRGGSGGNGGNGNSTFPHGGNGGTGGVGSGASATAATTAGFTSGTVTAIAVGGNGGDGGSGGSPSFNGTGGDGGTGGNGGGATASASATGTGDFTVIARATGGNGGSGGGPGSFGSPGSLPGNGANGAGVTLNNNVTGSTPGALTLIQEATGGEGGGGELFIGFAGDAVSKINQTLLAPSQLTGTTTATGGRGGRPYDFSGSFGTPGGDATAETILTGSGAVFSTASATGGSIQDGRSAVFGGSAQANAQATSVGGGHARAIANVTSRAKNEDQSIRPATAQATTNNPGTGAVRAAQANTSLTVPRNSSGFGGTTERALSDATLGPGQTYTRSDATLGGGTNAGALIQATPSFADVAVALATHPNVAAAFLPATTDLLGRASLGGGRGAMNGSFGFQTLSSSVTLTLDSAQLAYPSGNFEIGLLDPISSGNFSNTTLRFQLQINGVTTVDQTFTDIAIANTYFTDHVLDLGPVPAGISTLTALLDLTTLNNDTGYNIEFLVGNSIPEPSTYMLLGGGLLTLLGVQRVRSRRRPRAEGSGTL